MTKPLEIFTKFKDAWDYVGGLSSPSKMPGFSYGIPAKSCKTGSKLRKVEGSVCSVCYALKGMYTFENVRVAQEKRLGTLYKPYWVAAMTYILKVKLRNARTKDCSVFRHFDSGDVQSQRHLLNICSVAKATPEIKHWMPTREVGMIIQFLKAGHKVPSNMTIRISANMIGKAPAYRHPLLKDTPGIAFSAVSYEEATQCKAYLNDGHCGDCRECWDPEVRIVSYPKH